MHADGISLDDTVSFFPEHRMCVYVGGGAGVCMRVCRGELSISLHYCFLKSLVIHYIERHLLQGTGKCAFD